MIPSSSRLSDLPGYRQPSIILLLLPLLFVPLSDACNPSWFREERSVPDPPQKAIGENDLEIIDLPPESKMTSSEEDYSEGDIFRPCTIEYTGRCKNGATCRLTDSPVKKGKSVISCLCTERFHGEFCDGPNDSNVYAAPVLYAGDGSRISLPAITFFAILSIITLGGAFVFYRKLTYEDKWELTESGSPCTPFSNRTSSTMSAPRRNLWSCSTRHSATSLNPALTRKGGLRLDDTFAEVTRADISNSTVSVHPSISLTMEL